jgi:hypothetical protein
MIQATEEKKGQKKESFFCEERAKLERQDKGRKANVKQECSCSSFFCNQGTLTDGKPQYN